MSNNQQFLALMWGSLTNHLTSGYFHIKWNLIITSWQSMVKGKNLVVVGDLQLKGLRDGLA